MSGREALSFNEVVTCRWFCCLWAVRDCWNVQSLDISVLVSLLLLSVSVTLYRM